MTTINRMEDLIRILDEHPEWIEALRARLLTRELLDLPQNFAKFVMEMREFKSEMNQFVVQTNQFVAATNRRLDNIDARLDEHDARFDKIDVTIQKIRDDLTPLKGSHARNAAVEDAITLARDMGLRRTKILTREDLWDLTDAADITDIPTNELRSFRRADLIMESTGQDGETCYIAAEISFTANGRDTTRAIRNAGFLTRFTGKRSYTAVAGLYRDERIQGSIESGEVFWHQLEPEQLGVE